MSGVLLDLGILSALDALEVLRSGHRLGWIGRTGLVLSCKRLCSVVSLLGPPTFLFSSLVFWLPGRGGVNWRNVYQYHSHYHYGRPHIHPSLTYRQVNKMSKSSPCLTLRAQTTLLTLILIQFGTSLANPTLPHFRRQDNGTTVVNGSTDDGGSNNNILYVRLLSILHFASNKQF